MATRVYKVAVVGCPRSVLSPEGLCDGVGKSCLCNRFIRSEAYTEDHQQETSQITEEEWTGNPVFNGDHFIYWGAANKHLPDKTKVRFQIVEHTEFYKKASVKKREEEEDSDYYYSSSEEDEPESKKKESHPEVLLQLESYPAPADYVIRSCALHFRSKRQGKMGYRLKALEEAVRKTVGLVRAVTQLFPNEDFGTKKSIGIYGFVCVFDPTLEGDQMQRQLNFLVELLPSLMKTKRKVVVACVKCDMVEDHMIKFGTAFFSHTLKKPVPFFEVSARDSVNVDDIFFSLISPQKKQAKSLRRGHSMYISYNEVVDSRKGDLNRAKDAFRKMLQENIKDFSITWSTALLFLESNHVYQAVRNLAGSEADDMLLKMFQLRLIEIKLMEASKQYGDSVAKKADKEHSRQYQIYLKQAFTGHPDLKGDSSYKDYIPELSESDDTDILTEPSTPSASCCPTPDGREALSRCSRTFPDDRDFPSINDNRSLDDISTCSSARPVSMIDSKHFKFSPSLNTKVRGLPPLPGREATLTRTSIASSSPSPSRSKKLSSSVDQLNVQREADNGEAKKVSGGASIDRLDVEPYLQPMEVKKVLGQSMRLKESHRNAPGFMSMRTPKRTGQPPLKFMKSPEQHRTSSLDRRTHKRSHSNPHLLESVADSGQSNPPELPPRNLDSLQATPVHKKTASADSCCSPMSLGESSLEFVSLTAVDGVRRPTEKPLPPIPDDSPEFNSSNGSIIRNRIITSKSMDMDGDNLSQQSGPFDEIEEEERRKMAKSRQESSLSDLISPRDGLLPQKPPVLTQRSGQSNSEDDQYARIEEFQYMTMNPAPTVRMISKSKTLPSLPGLPKKQEDVVAPPAIPRTHAKSLSSAQLMSQFSGAQVKSQRRDTVGPIVSTLRRFKKSMGSETIPEELLDEELPPTPSPPPLSRHTAIKQDIRPLPPSPIKRLSDNSHPLLRKLSNGSNIYDVIDDEFKNELRNRPSRQGSRREYLAEWAPPVDHSLWPKYLEVTRTFFSLPQVQELWVDTVKSIMGNVDAEEINPPYFNLDPYKVTTPTGLQDITEVAQKQDQERSSSSSPLEAESKLLSVHGTIAPASTPDSLDSRLLIHTESPSVPPHLDGNRVAESRSPAKEAGKQSGKGHQPPKPPMSGNDLIYALNQFQHYNSDDSDSSSDSDDESDQQDKTASESISDSELDSDIDISLGMPPPSQEDHASNSAVNIPSSEVAGVEDARPASVPPSQGKEETEPELQTSDSTQSTPSRVPPKPKPKPKPKPRPRNFSQKLDPSTSLDLRGTDSNDSDKVSMDSAIAKSPRSFSVGGDFDLDHVTSEEGEGVEVVHNVKPSQFFKKRSVSYNRLASPSGKVRGDSGTYDDDSLQTPITTA